MQASDIMTQPVVACRPTDSLDHAAALLWKEDVGALPVVDESGRAVGMITDRDICMAAYMQGSPLHALPVRLAMSRSVQACLATDPVDAVARRMAEHQVRRIPILSADMRVVGVVSLMDLVGILEAPALMETLSSIGKRQIRNVVLTQAC